MAETPVSPDTAPRPPSLWPKKDGWWYWDSENVDPFNTLNQFPNDVEKAFLADSSIEKQISVSGLIRSAGYGIKAIGEHARNLVQLELGIFSDKDGAKSSERILRQWFPRSRFAGLKITLTRWSRFALGPDTNKLYHTIII